MERWENFIIEQSIDCDDPKGFADIMRSLYYLKYECYPESYKQDIHNKD